MRGIVTLAGGPTYFLNAYLNCLMLRRMGCSLPVQWFHFEGEMKSEWVEKVREIPGVSLINLGGEVGDKTKGRGGWQAKPKAILESTFEEILFLDADCFPLLDPEYLFSDPFYKETNAVLYPDPYSWNDYQLDIIERKFGVRPPHLQVESGQMLFHRSKCIDALKRTVEINQDPETYRILYGDKDTFVIGMLQTKTEYRVNPHRCTGGTIGMRHKDFQGNDLFLHLAGGKWRPHGRPFIKESDYPYRQQAIEIIGELKSAKLI